MLVLLGCGDGAPTDATDATDDTDVVVVDDTCRPTWPIDRIGSTWTFGPAEGWLGGEFVATEVATGEGEGPEGRPGWWVDADFVFDRPEGERFEVSSRRLYRCGPLGYGILYEEEITELETADRLERTERVVTYAEPMIEVGLAIELLGRWRSVTSRVVIENDQVIEDGAVSRSCTGVAEEAPVLDGLPPGIRFDCIGDLDLDLVVADGVGPVRWGDFRQLVAWEPAE